MTTQEMRKQIKKILSTQFTIIKTKVIKIGLENVVIFYEYYKNIRTKNIVFIVYADVTADTKIYDNNYTSIYILDNREKIEEIMQEYFNTPIQERMRKVTKTKIKH